MNKNVPTNYKNGFKRILVLIAIGWFGFWAMELADEYSTDQHRKLIMFSGSGAPTFTYLTLGNTDHNTYSGSAAFRMLDGDRYVFFFNAEDAKGAKAAEDWVNNLSREDIEKAKEVSSISRRHVMWYKASIALGVPLAVMVVWSIGLYVYRGFRPKAKAVA